MYWIGQEDAKNQIVLYPIQNQISSKKEGLGLKELRGSHGIRKETIWGVILLDPSWITFDDLGLAEILAAPDGQPLKMGMASE